MTRNVNLNSSEWCDLIFEGKNKSYGAYEMRQTSSRRHILSFLIVVILTGLVASVPSLMEAVKSTKDDLGKMDDTFVITNITPLEEQVPEEMIVRQEIAPPPVKIRETIRLTPPVIVEDENVTEGEEMLSQDELNENRNAQIAVHTMAGSTDDDAITFDDLNENRLIVQGTPDEKPLEYVEQMPQYRGGNGELIKFISGNLKYPAIAIESTIEGRVMVRFVVGKDGSVSNVSVLRGIDPACDKEAMRVVSSMPPWIPGMQNGNPVAVYFTLPIVFKIQR